MNNVEILEFMRKKELALRASACGGRELTEAEKAQFALSDIHYKNGIEIAKREAEKAETDDLPSIVKIKSEVKIKK